MFFPFKGEGEREREGPTKEIYETCIIERNDNLTIMGLQSGLCKATQNG